MSFGQRNVTTYKHNICKRHLRSMWGTGLSKPKKTPCNWKTLATLAKHPILKYMKALTAQYIKSKVVNVVEQLFNLLFGGLRMYSTENSRYMYTHTVHDQHPYSASPFKTIWHLTKENNKPLPPLKVYLSSYTETISSDHYLIFEGNFNRKVQGSYFLLTLLTSEGRLTMYLKWSRTASKGTISTKYATFRF